MRVIKALLLIATIHLVSCEPQMKFDKNGWQSGGATGYPPPSRKEMLKDLLSNYRLKGLSYRQIINLLGEPNGIDNSTVFYDIALRYDMIDIDYAKSLLIVLDKDSIAREVKVYERKNKEVRIYEWNK